MNTNDQIVYKLIYDVKQSLTKWTREILTDNCIKYSNIHTIKVDNGNDFFMDYILYDVRNRREYANLIINRYKDGKSITIKIISENCVDILIEIIKRTGNYKDLMIKKEY